MMTAPIAAVKTAPIQPSPRLIPNLPSDQFPTKLPTIPMMIFPKSPKPVPLNIRLPSHPAMAPTMIVLIISIV